MAQYSQRTQPMHRSWNPEDPIPRSLMNIMKAQNE